MAGKKKGLFNKLVGWSYIKSSLSEATNLIKSERKTDYIVESFDEALERLGITTDDEIYEKMKKNYNGRRISSIIMLSVSIMVFIQLIYNITFNFNTVGYISILIQTLAFTALFLIGLYDSFRCYQIRVRKLGGLNIFLKSIKNIYPISFNKIDWLEKIKVVE